MKTHLLPLCLSASLLLPLFSARESHAAQTTNLGMNTNEPGYDYTPDKAFADAMRSHRTWEFWVNGVHTHDDHLDANGWPTADGQACVWVGLNTHDNYGTYKLYFTGTGDVRTGVNNNGLTFANKAYDAQTNTTTADLICTDTANSVLYLFFSNTNGGIKNIKLMRPTFPGSTQSYPPDKVFSDIYVNRLAPFKCIRYMGWSGTNSNGDSLWTDRTLWTYARQEYPGVAGRTYWTGRGAAWESVIKLANTTGKDAWINIPHKATDDYIRNLALLFKNGSAICEPLNPDLKLYVEYSNEVWNWGGPAFTQTGWCNDQSKTYGHPLDFDGPLTNGDYARYKAMRSVQMSTIFREVFGDAQMMTRVRPVMCWQQNYNDIASQSLAFIDRFYNKRDPRSDWNDPHPVNYYLYGGGGSFYWYTSSGTGLTTDNIWDNGGWNPQNYYNRLANDVACARGYGLTYIGYEGDNHPAYNGDEPIMQQIHWDPRMKGETTEHLQVLNRQGVDLACFLVLANVSPCVWGAINQQDSSKSPQYEAIKEFNAASGLPIDIGTLTPFSRAGRAFDLRWMESWVANGPAGVITLKAGGAAGYKEYTSTYLFRVDTSRYCNLKINYSTTQAASFAVDVDGAVVATFSPGSTGGVATMTPATRIAIRSGSIHAVRVVVLSGAINLNTVIMENDIILSADKRPALLMHGNGIRMDLVRSDLRIDMGACGGTVSLLDMRGATVRTIRMSGPGTVGLGGLSAGAYTVTARTDRGDFAHMGLIVNKR